MGSRQDPPVGKLNEQLKSRKAQLEARIACKKVKVTGDHLRLAGAEARKYSGSLEEMIDAVTPRLRCQRET
jgi:hypothetical protein